MPSVTRMCTQGNWDQEHFEGTEKIKDSCRELSRMFTNFAIHTAIRKLPWKHRESAKI